MEGLEGSDVVEVRSVDITILPVLEKELTGDRGEGLTD